MEPKTDRRAGWTVALVTLSLAALGCADAGASRGSGAESKTAAAPMPASDRISMAEFKKLHSANGVVVIDVRSQDAYQGGHIPGALSMPEETLDGPAAEKLKKMGKPIATYCS
jgi:3-mercaptopyruvate sulfurtransferase SseA